ncbi:MAG TPA: hypothetical protein VHH34_09165, partial [Pseudonocardiaceae bacterium]|nr:hypothetical protein [Pseudonocardiaceae bacterium]
MRQTSDLGHFGLTGTAMHRPPPPPQPALALRALRGFSGVLAGGLVVLAVTVAGAQWLIGSAARPGPGTAFVLGHGTAALIAVVLQVVADRSQGARATLAATAVLVLTAAV